MDKVITEAKMRHMHGVAEYMYAHAEKYGLDKEEMYLLGLLHDIGYIRGKEGHEQFGGDFVHYHGLMSAGAIIQWHGYTPQAYMERTKSTVEEIPDELILLWEADMHIDASGCDVGYKARLKDIGYRYGFNSEVYRNCEKTVKWLSSHGH